MSPDDDERNRGATKPPTLKLAKMVDPSRLPDPNQIIWRGSVRDLVTDLKAALPHEDLLRLIEILQRTVRQPIQRVNTQQLSGSLRASSLVHPEIQEMISAVAQAEINFAAANDQYAEAGKYVEECHTELEAAQAKMREAWRQLIDTAKQAEIELGETKD